MMECSEYRCARTSVHEYLYAMPTGTRVLLGWCDLHTPSHRWVSHDHRNYECHGCGLKYRQLLDNEPLPKGPCLEKGVE